MFTFEGLPPFLAGPVFLKSSCVNLTLNFHHLLLLPPPRDDGVPLDDSLVDPRQADRADGVRPDRVLGELDEGNISSEVGVRRIVIVVGMGDNALDLKT